MCAHMAVLGAFPDTPIIQLVGLAVLAMRKFAPERGPLMHRKWMGMLLAAAFPLSSAAIAQEAQSASDQSGAGPAGGQSEPAAQPSLPTLGPSMTGPLHLNSNALHVDSGTIRADLRLGSDQRAWSHPEQPWPQ